MVFGLYVAILKWKVYSGLTNIFKCENNILSEKQESTILKKKKF